MSHEADPARAAGAARQRPADEPGIAIDWKAEPGTLPTLRFGHGYRVRARAMDLAGNAVALDKAADDEAQPVGQELVYRRFEPVPAPTFVLRARLDAVANAGEASDRMVVRTENSAESLDTTAGVAGGERRLRPPRASVGLAESHGFLDDAAGRPRADLYGELRDRDTRSSSQRIPRARSSSPRPTRSSSRTSPTRSRGRRASRPAGCVGRLRNAAAVHFKDEWPAAVGLRIAVEDGDGPPSGMRPAGCSSCNWPRRTWCAARSAAGSPKTTSSSWPCGTGFANGSTSCADRPARLMHLTDELDEAARRGARGWALDADPAARTRARSAVRQPLGRPWFADLRAERAAAGTATRFTGVLAVHGKSTSRIDLLARWTEPSDLADGNPPDLAVPHGRSPTNSCSTSCPLPATRWCCARETGRSACTAPTTTASASRASRACGTSSTIRATAGCATPRARATTRFREYFPPDDPGDFTRTGEEIVVDVPASARPAAPQPLYAMPTFGWERQEHTGVRVSRRWRRRAADPVCAALVLVGRRRAAGRRRARPRWTSGPAGSCATTSRSGDATPSSTAPLPSELLMQFPAAAEIAGPLILAELGDGHTVHVATHRVDYDADRDAWFCDVEIRPGASYRPFVRLAWRAANCTPCRAWSWGRSSCSSSRSSPPTGR